MNSIYTSHSDGRNVALPRMARSTMKKIAIFASGNGSNFEALAEACKVGDIDACVVALVCDKPNAFVIQRAKKYPHIDIIVVDPQEYKTKSDYEAAIISRLKLHQINLICLAGYMRIVGKKLLSVYGDRIINIHPSLLPAFKGAHAIRDAFNYGVKVFGVTIHYVDETLDGGRIIAQAPVIYNGGDIDELEGFIHRTEHRLYIDTVKQLLGDFRQSF